MQTKEISDILVRGDTFCLKGVIFLHSLLIFLLLPINSTQPTNDGPGAIFPKFSLICSSIQSSPVQATLHRLLGCRLRHIKARLLDFRKPIRLSIAHPLVRSFVRPPPSHTYVTIIKLCSEQQQQPQKQRYRFAIAIPEQLSELEFSFLDQSSVLCTLPSLPFSVLNHPLAHSPTP